MTPLVRKTLLFILTLAPALLAPLTASAKDIRFPAKGFPAYVFILPDDWSSEADDYGNLLMSSATHVTSLVIIIGVGPEALDEIARVALETAKATPYDHKEPAEISGCKGFTYFSNMTNPSGVQIKLEMTIVRVDARNFASASLLLASGVTKTDETTARILKNSFKLVME